MPGRTDIIWIKGVRKIMKIHQILETELPIYRDYLKNFDDWLEIKNSGRYNPDKYDGDFDCRKENLPSLIGSPIEVTGTFMCEQNFLRTLHGGPQKVGGTFDCTNNLLTSLEFAPKTTGSIFYATQNQITSLRKLIKYPIFSFFSFAVLSEEHQPFFLCVRMF